MLGKIKKTLYFPIAYYFRFFAKIQLLIWKPKIIVITGSSGKTTLLHLLESQIKERAEYSHFANSSFGIPFDILGLKRKDLTLDEWPALFLLAPIRAFQKKHTKNLYIVEADCDRPNEGRFLADLLNPEVTCWLSCTKTHSANFRQPIEENIAHEFGYFLEHTKKLSIINNDSVLIQQQIKRSTSIIEKISIENLENYHISQNTSEFKIEGKTYKFKFLLPKETYYQIEALLKILRYLNITPDPLFKNFTLPPGRSSLFKGKKDTTILDSSYNTDLESMRVMLNMFDQTPFKNKWVVLGDMVEQGDLEKQEHEALGQIINSMNLDKVILIGPRLTKYTKPKVKNAITFIYPSEVLKYLEKNLKGKEVILFKGARFLEGIIEQLLLNKEDISKLCRREKIWQERRKQWGL